ncbi:TonB family protein [Myxococcota bacterium]|nr:TonB family protein [Myxococcota bacterium]
MRKRSHQRGLAVLAGSFVASIAVNVLVGLPLLGALGWYLQGARDAAKERPVKVVTLSAEQWSRNRRTSDAAPRAPATPSKADALTRAKPLDGATEQPASPKEPERPKPEEKLSGRVVDVPPTADDTPAPDAKYLAKYNTRVEKETTARVEDLDLKAKRVTNRRQSLERPTPTPGAIATPNVSMKGNGATETPAPDAKDAKGDLAAKRKFIFEMPDLMRRDAVKLDPGLDLGLGRHVASRVGSEEMRGNSDRLRLQMGTGDDDEDADGDGAAKGSADGEGEKPLPTLAAIMPAFGVPGAMAGAPKDHVDGLPEGDGTFLNAREFKYATFFLRVRDSVASYWEGSVTSEYRRRDPTGNIYGTRDRATVLRVELNREGRLSDVRIEQTSGVDFLDHVAVDAFKRAGPFPNPPAGLVEEDGAIRFNFQFVVTMNSRGGFDVFRFQ